MVKKKALVPPFAMILPRVREHMLSVLQSRMIPMSASARTSNNWRSLTSLGLAAGGALFMAASSASAQSNRCAIYGSGFVSLNGTDTCVRIGGRVRVDGVIVPSQDVFGSRSNSNSAPGALNGLDGPDRAHMRLQGGSSGGMPRTR
jgi:hypothetical protein